MADALKKGIAAKFLLPLVGAYIGVAAALSLSAPADLTARLAPFVGAAGVMGLMALVAEEVVPRSFKEVVVFWRRTHRLPGYRAFSKIALADGRVDPGVLKSLLPAAALTPEQENQTWYKWLKETENDPGISQNHRNFLVLRDAAVLAAGMTVFSPLLLTLDADAWRRVLALTFAVGILYLVLMASARNSACRLVGNVIALKTAKSGSSTSAKERPKPARTQKDGRRKMAK
jgi:hypothetical protein